MSTAELVGLAATLITVISPLPQVVKTVRTRNIRCLSLPSCVLSCCCTSLWLAYGIVLRDLPIIACDAVMVLLQIVLAATILTQTFKRKGLNA